MFNNFFFSREKIAEFDKLDVEVKSTILNKYPCVFFEYKIDENIPGKVGEENGIFFKIDSIQLICFNTGICFEVIKTHIENSNSFDDVLDFNYKFKNVNYSSENVEEDEKIKIQTSNFENMQDIKKLINNLIIKSKLTEKLDIDTEKLYTYTYTCIEQENWNDNKKFEEIKNELNSEVETNSESIVKTYEITNNDMENYKAKKEYVPGKKNPFAPVDTSSDTDSTDDDASSVITTPGGNSNSSGSLFEKPGTK